MEEEARGVFQSGNAAFMRNWPYAWKLANAPDSPIRGKVGMSALPRGDGEGGRNASALGGWSLAVSRYSKHPKEARSLVAHLASRQEQKRRALALGQNPTIPSLYADADLLKDNPSLPALLKIFETAVARPSAATGAKYSRVTAECWEQAHSALSKEISPAEALRRLEDRLVFLSRGGKW